MVFNVSIIYKKYISQRIHLVRNFDSIDFKGFPLLNTMEWKQLFFESKSRISYILYLYTRKYDNKKIIIKFFNQYNDIVFQTN